MSGLSLRVIETNFFDFKGAGASQTITMPVAQRIDVSQYREAGLLVRIIQIEIVNTGTSGDDIQIAVAEDPWDPFSGPVVFAPETTTGAAAPASPYPLAQTSLNPNYQQTPPSNSYFLFFPLTAPFGGLLEVNLYGVGGSARSAGDALSVALNADLILKD